MRVRGAAIFLLSAAAVSYEILLLRLLSILQWHHFASMIISVALLGYGASGTFVGLLGHRLERGYIRFFTMNAVLSGLGMAAGLALLPEVRFSPLELLWDPVQFLRLTAVYLLLFIPFFFAANAICLTFLRFRETVQRVYRADLLGAGAGALGALLLLSLFPPARCVAIVSCGGPLAAGWLAFREKRGRLSGALLALGVAGLLAALTWPPGPPGLGISEYKGLSQALRVPGARVLAERFGPLGWLTVVESPRIPFRHAPGLSLNCALEPPPQLALFTDGEGLSPLTRYRGDPAQLAFLGCLSGALPYHLLQKPEVLVLGAGGGSDILTALHHGAGRIEAVEMNPQVIGLMKGPLAEWAGNVFEAPGVTVRQGEARGAVMTGHGRYDLITVSMLDSFQSAAAGSGGISASYLYTVEALRTYYDRLRPGGFLSITRWLKIPPRDTLKLFATAVRMLQEAGVTEPGLQLAVIRSWKTATLLLKRGALSASDLAAVRAFCDERSFDLDYLPGLRESEVNRHNVLQEPHLHLGAVALLGPDAGAFVERYKFDIRPATDDRPYFFHYFRWATLREVWDLRGRGGLPLLEWGYPLLVGTLLQAALLGLLLLVLPLLLSGAQEKGGPRRTRPALYFAGLGLAFMFVEIAFIERFILYLHHPVYAASAVLAAFLVFAGLGSGFSGRWARLAGRRVPVLGRAPIAGAIALICILVPLYLALLPLLFRRGRRRPGALALRALAPGHRAAGFLHGDALSARPAAGRRPAARFRALGLGTERVGLGARRGAGQPAGGAFRAERPFCSGGGPVRGLCCRFRPAGAAAGIVAPGSGLRSRPGDPGDADHRRRPGRNPPLHPVKRADGGLLRETSPRARQVTYSVAMSSR